MGLLVWVPIVEDNEERAEKVAIEVVVEL